MTVHPRSLIFDVRPGEWRPLLVIGGAMGAILAAHTIAETARDALFLQRVPTRWLALVYLALAALAVIALAGNARVIRRLGRRQALVSTLMVAAFGTTMFYVLRTSDAVAFALYLWTGLLGTVVVAQFWLLAATYFTSSEAKRLYGLVAAMGALGALLGALSATGLLYLISVKRMLPVAAGFYVLAALILAWADDPALEAMRSNPARPQPAPSDSTRLREHPYVLRLAALSLLGVAAALVADYLLKATAATQLAPSELPQFFARYNSVVSVLSLILQLVGASWLLRKVGALGAVTILPAALLLGGSATVLTGGAFIAVAMTRGADASMRHSVNRVSSELLWMPVPAELRTRVREALESVFARAAQAATALLLLGLALAGVMTPLVMAGLLVGLAAAWLVVASSLRAGYLTELRGALMKPSFDTDQELDIASVEVVVEALASLDDKRVIAAVKVLQRHHRTRLIPALLLHHDSPEVIAVALDAIAVKDRTDWMPLTQRLLDADHPLIRIAAIRALARAGEREAIRKGLADGDPVVRASAVFWEANSSDVPDLLAFPPVAALLDADDADSDTVRRIVIEAIRDDGGPRWKSVLIKLAEQDDPALIGSLSRAIERVPDPSFVSFLVGRLATRAGRSDVRAALIAIGAPALDHLEHALVDGKTPPRIRLHIPTTIAMYGSPRAGQILMARLEAETSGAVRYRLLRAIARLAIHHRIRFDVGQLLDELRHHVREHFRLMGLAVAIEREHDPRASARLLRGLLRDKISQARDRVFLVLQSLHPREDVRSIERAFEAGARVARAHAFEFLDTLTRSRIYDDPRADGLRDAMLVAYEELGFEKQIERVGAFVDPPATPAESLARLLRDSDSLLAACAAYHSLELGPSALSERVRDLEHERPGLLAPLGLSTAEAPG